MLEDPVFLPSAPHVFYERSALVDWLAGGGGTCPMNPDQPASVADVLDAEEPFKARLAAFHAVNLAGGADHGAAEDDVSVGSAGSAGSTGGKWRAVLCRHGSAW